MTVHHGESRIDPEAFYAALGPRLRRLREQQGLSRAEVARRMGTPNDRTCALWNWETGRARPQWENLYKLAQALNVSLYDVLFREVEV